MTIDDLLFPAEPRTRAIARELYAPRRGPAADQPARARRPGHPRRRRAVPRPGPAAHRARPLRDPDAAQPGHPARPSSACRRVDGGPVETDGRTIWRTLRRRTGTCSGAPRRGCGWSRRFADGLRRRHPARPGHRRRGLRRARRPARRAGVPAAGAVRAVQHRGARHHRVAAGRPGRARQARRRRLGRAGRPGDHHVPARRRGRHGVGRLGRPGRPARRDHRRGHRHVRRLPGRAAPAPGGVHRRRRHLLRPRPPDRADLGARRGRGGRGCSQRGLRGEADAGRRRGLPGAHARRVRPDVARGRPGDAAAPGLGAQPQPLAARARTAATSAATSRRPPSTRTRSRRCWTRTATTRGCGWSSTPSTSTPSPASSPRWPAATRRCYLGAPWWFLDSPEVLRRFREAVTETAGFYNTAGFVDDTRAFCSIPVRHDVARRVDAGFLARLVAEHRLPLDEAAETIADLAYHLPKRVFRLEELTHDTRSPPSTSTTCGSRPPPRATAPTPSTGATTRRPMWSCTPTPALTGAGLHLHQRPGQRDHLRGGPGAGPPRAWAARSRRSSPSRWRSGAR